MTTLGVGRWIDDSGKCSGKSNSNSKCNNKCNGKGKCGDPFDRVAHIVL